MSPNGPIDDTAAAASSQFPSRRPPPKWVLGVIIAIVVGLNILGFFVAATWPKLVKHHPLLLIMLSNRYRYLLLTRGQIAAVPQVIVGVLRNLASDPVYYALGWFYGDKVLDLFRKSLGKGDAVIVATERWFHKVADLIVFISPSPFVCALAGATGMRGRRFWPINIAGTITMVVGVRLLGKQINGPINSFLRFNERYNKWIFASSIAFVLFVVMNAGLGGKKAETLRDVDRSVRDGD